MSNSLGVILGIELSQSVYAEPDLWTWSRF